MQAEVCAAGSLPTLLVASAHAAEPCPGPCRSCVSLALAAAIASEKYATACPLAPPDMAALQAPIRRPGTRPLPQVTPPEPAQSTLLPPPPRPVIAVQPAADTWNKYLDRDAPAAKQPSIEPPTPENTAQGMRPESSISRPVPLKLLPPEDDGPTPLPVLDVHKPALEVRWRAAAAHLGCQGQRL